MSSSIGHVGRYPIPDTSERLRAIVPELIDADALTGVSRELDSYLDGIGSEGTPETRVSLRIICPARVEGMLPRCEAILPLGGGLSLAYLGCATPERSLSRDELDEISARKRHAERRFGPGRTPDLAGIERRFTKARSRGYLTETISSSEGRRRALEEDRDPIAALLEPFGYRGGAVDSLICEPDNLVAVARHGREVVGIVVAETAEIVLGSPSDRSLRITELTDSSVAEAHAGHSLQALLHVRLIESLVQDACPDVIFSESTYGGSLANAAMLGRRFAGTLPKHVTIGGGDRDTQGRPRYESLEVTYLTPDGARSLVGDLRRQGTI